MQTWKWFIILAAACGVWGEDALIDQRVTITKCCPSGYGLLADHSCIPFDTGPFTPPVLDDEEGMNNREVVGDENWDSECGKSHILEQLYLGNETKLYLIGDEVFLYWLSPDTFSWVLVDSFCVAMSADESAPERKSQYLVEFCHKDPIIQWQEDEVACANATCVRKCCPERQIFNGTCQLPDKDFVWAPTFHLDGNNSIVPVSKQPSDLLIVYGMPECPLSLIYDEYILLESGELKVHEFPSVITQSDYCLDAFVDEEGGFAEKLVLCNADEESNCFWRYLIVDTLFMSISCVFLAITWIIYVCISELRANTHGRCMISFITALFVAFVTILVNRNHRETFSSFECSLTAVLSHLSILATFFWLNILSYHIWNCLRSGVKRDEKKVFLAYCFYGWGCPFIIALVGVILDATKADVLRPDFWPPHCWFKDRTTKWVYQYGFMLALLIVNLVFFLSSVVLVTKRLRVTHDMKYHSEGLWFYLKLFIVMGITWLMEMITWLLETNNCKTWVVVLDGITSLHGVYIFLVAVCFRSDLRIFRRCCGKTKYDIEGNTVSCTRDNFVELLDGQAK